MVRRAENSSIFACFNTSGVDLLYRRKMILTGPGYQHFRLSIPGEVARALHAENGEELNLELVSTDCGETILIVSRGD